jgi:hypothetical protein
MFQLCTYILSAIRSIIWLHDLIYCILPRPGDNDFIRVCMCMCSCMYVAMCVCVYQLICQQQKFMEPMSITHAQID